MAEIPGVGWSSPVVWGRNIFLTAAESDQPMKQPSLGTDFSNDYIAELRAQGLSSEEVNARLYARDREMPDEIVLRLKLYCYDLENGKRLWEREVYRGNPRGGRHRKNSFASETPVTDGENVYVYFTQHGLYAFDVDGKEVWTAPLAAHPTIRDYGTGASPALHADRLFVLNDNEEESFLAAFDKRTGKEIWRTPRSFSTPRKTGWSTPFVWENELRTEVVTIGPGAVISYGLDGKELWRMERMGAVAIQSPFAWNGLLYVTSGTSGDDNRPIVAIRPGGSGDITPKEPGNEERARRLVQPAGRRHLSADPTHLRRRALCALRERNLRPTRPRDRRACLSIPHRARCFRLHGVALGLQRKDIRPERGGHDVRHRSGKNVSPPGASTHSRTGRSRRRRWQVTGCWCAPRVACTPFARTSVV